MNKLHIDTRVLSMTLVALLGLSLAVRPALAATYYPIIVPGSNMTSARGINVRSQVVGYYTGPSGGFQGFLLNHGKYWTVNYPGAPNTLLSGINKHEAIVGYYDDGIFIHGFTLVHGKFAAFDCPGASNMPPALTIRGESLVSIRSGASPAATDTSWLTGILQPSTCPARPRLTPPGSMPQEIFVDRFSMQAASYMDSCCTMEPFKPLTIPIPLERMQMA